MIHPWARDGLPTRRGYLTPGRIGIASTFPLGLLRAWTWFDCDDQVCIVYPRPEGIRQLPDSSEFTLEEQSGVKTGTDDFTGFKSYRPGDSTRNINWKVYAREQGLLVKKFSGSGSDRLMLCAYPGCGGTPVTTVSVDYGSG